MNDSPVVLIISVAMLIMSVIWLISSISDLNYEINQGKTVAEREADRQAALDHYQARQELVTSIREAPWYLKVIPSIIVLAIVACLGYGGYLLHQENNLSKEEKWERELADAANHRARSAEREERKRLRGLGYPRTEARYLARQQGELERQHYLGNTRAYRSSPARHAPWN